ncbi:helix-turn-helix domain-containing protein [Streptomyces litmocidini]|uniref:Helix-turn-helix domain-containing protein n=1 Tax=Streptomyces litmocidini TaxID=67318 RepID=A0ABW7UHU5_9ACTN
MTFAISKYADFENLRKQAIALRREGLSRRQIRDRLHIDNNDILNRLLEGEPPPEWTKRPNAKDDLRARARELRLQGWTYDQIQVELGCSKSSISLWVRDLPKPEPRYTPEEQRALMRAGLVQQRRARRDEYEAARETAKAAIRKMTDQELLIAGVALYWAEGAKSKPYSRRERVVFINSDPNVILVFLAWLQLLDVAEERISFRLMIHESADVRGAEQYWADLVGVGTGQLKRTTLKKHNPLTTRKNTGETYHGCLVVDVAKSAELYHRIEGWWGGIVAHSMSGLR